MFCCLSFSITYKIKNEYTTWTFALVFSAELGGYEPECLHLNSKSVTPSLPPANYWTSLLYFLKGVVWEDLLFKYNTRKTTLKTMPSTKQGINHYLSYSSPLCFLVQGLRGGSWKLILIAGAVWLWTKNIPRRGDTGVGGGGAPGRMEQRGLKSLKCVPKQWG